MARHDGRNRRESRETNSHSNRREAAERGFEYLVNDNINPLSKRIHSAVGSIIIMVLPVISLDFFRINFLVHWLVYPFRALETVADSVYKVSKSSILLVWLRPIAYLFWMTKPIADMEPYNLKKKTAKKGVKKAAGKAASKNASKKAAQKTGSTAIGKTVGHIIASLADEGVEVALTPTVIGAFVANIVLLPFTAEFWKFLEDTTLLERAHRAGLPVEKPAKFYLGKTELRKGDKEAPQKDDIDRLETTSANERGRQNSSPDRQKRRRRSKSTPTRNRRGRRDTREDDELVTGRNKRSESNNKKGLPLGILKKGGAAAMLVLIVGAGLLFFSGGVGQAAAEEVQDETVGGVAPGVTEDAGDATSSFLQTASAWGSCISRGQTAGCVREWQLENTETKRPDSTDSTKTFDLKVSEDDFTLGRKGERFDVSSNPAEKGIPIRMRAFNIRRGIKGIDARNVEIRVSIVDGTLGDGTLTDGGALCDTDWIPIQNLPQIPGYDSDGDGKQDDLPPGAAISSRLRLDKERIPESTSLDGDYITPKSCHMLQPSAGDGVETFLSVRYDYFSTAGLIFEAMSQDYILNQGISQDTKQSKSPDTPVQASLSVTGPVSAREDSISSFNVQTLLETGENNVRFITKDMRLINSRRACIQGEGLEDPECVTEEDGNPVSCSFRPSADSQHRLKPKSNIMTRYREGPRTDNFFDDTDSPPLASCQMMLREPDSISRTGETLAIRMQANYTVVKDTQSDFEAANMLCTEKNCPHVFVLSGDSLNAKHLSATDNILEDEKKKHEIFWTHRRAECDAPDDAQDGCTAVSGDPQKGFEQAKKLDGGLKDSDGDFQTIEEGKIAMKIEDTSKDIFTACVRKDSVKNPDAMTGVHGVESSDLYRITGDDADPQLNWTGAEWELEDEESPCKGSSGSGSGGSGGSGSGSGGPGSDSPGGETPACESYTTPPEVGGCPTDRCIWDVNPGPGGSDGECETP